MSIDSTSKKPLRRGRRKTKLLERGMDVDQVPADARRQASCVLEVLAGLRGPEEAASVLGVSVPTYYNLETRALRGLVHGCTPEPPGRKMALEKRLREAEAKHVALERQVRRYQALLRSAQRAAGVLAAEPAAPRNAKTADGKAKRSRRPRVRAMRAIEALTRVNGQPPPPPEAPPPPPEASPPPPEGHEASS